VRRSDRNIVPAPRGSSGEIGGMTGNRFGPSLRLTLAAIAAATASCAHADQSDTIVIRNATVVDVEAGVLRPGLSIVIDQGRIVALDSAVTASRNAREIDGSGRYVIPGLWDMHVHLVLAGSEALKALVSQGVTGVRDAGGSPDSIALWRRQIASGTRVGPLIVAAGWVLESAPWLERLPKIEHLVDSLGAPPLSFRPAIQRIPVADPTSARAAVDSALARGGDFVKGRTYVDSATFFAIARRARERGTDFVGHPPPSSVRWVDAAQAGMTGIEHMGGAYAAEFGAMTADQRAAAFRALADAPLYLDPNVVDEEVRAMSDSAVAAVVADTLGSTHPAMRLVSHHLLESFRRDLAIRLLENRMQPPPDRAGFYRREVALLGEAFRAGVPVVTGTDLGALLMVPGSSIHDELRLLVQVVGLRPIDALRAATQTPAKALHLEATRGTVAVGKAADLVLLSGNPLEDIRNVDRIALVIAGGRVVQP
jgi:imidazolonepropionase-like amidohydrolase